jgi:hypothetical protein
MGLDIMNNINETGLSVWFSEHLKSSAEEFIWAVEQVPAERRTMAPPSTRLGERSVARHVFHLLAYEEHIALPAMRVWLGDPFPSIDHLDEDALWQEHTMDLQQMLEKFREVRAAQIELLIDLPDSAWQETREALWGPVTLRWVLTKTFQHTAEHIHNVLTLALFWDRALQRKQEEAQEKERD